MAATLADVLRVDRVSVQSDFFDDLGANSLLMADFNAHLRRRDVPVLDEGRLSPIGPCARWRRWWRNRPRRRQ